METEFSHSGIKGLDVILKGNLTPGLSVLVAGYAGTGKTIFTMQWLNNCYRSPGQECLYISLNETADDLRNNIKSFKWAQDKLQILDLSPKGIPTRAGEYSVFSPSEVELPGIWEAIYEAIETRKPSCVVIDSVTFLGYLSADNFQFRKQLLNLLNYLKRLKCTSMLIYEPEEMMQDDTLSLSVDCIVMLSRNVSPSRVTDIRTIEIQKLRGKDYFSGIHHFRITDEGIIIYPHIIEDSENITPADEKIESGISGLDKLLGGGIEKGTTTLITGPAGIGKSTFATHMCYNAAINGYKSVYYSFEESSGYIIKRLKGLGIPLEKYINDGTIKILHINPLQMFPDELLGNLRQEILNGVTCVVLDSMRGYEIAMEQYGNMRSHIQNMSNFLKSIHITTLFINEIEYITGNVRLTDFGISFMVDNAILLRFAEINGKLVRLVSCVKKRLSGFEPEVREFQFNPGMGITVGEKLEGFSGILSGTLEKIIPG